MANSDHLIGIKIRNGEISDEDGPASSAKWYGGSAITLTPGHKTKTTTSSFSRSTGISRISTF